MRRGQQSKGPGKEPAGQRTGGRALLRAATQHLRPSRRYDAPSHQDSLTGEKLSAPRHHTYFSRRTLWPRAVPFGRSLLPPLGAAASAPATGATVRAKEHPVPTGSQAKETRRKAGQGPGSVPGRHCLSAMPSSRRDGRELGSASGSSQASQGPEFVRNATTHELRSGDVVRALAPRFSPMASAPGPSGVMPWKTIPIPPASNELFYIHTFHLLPRAAAPRAPPPPAGSCAHRPRHMQRPRVTGSSTRGSSSRPRGPGGTPHGTRMWVPRAPGAHGMCAPTHPLARPAAWGSTRQRTCP